MIVPLFVCKIVVPIVQFTPMTYMHQYANRSSTESSGKVKSGSKNGQQSAANPKKSKKKISLTALCGDLEKVACSPIRPFVSKRIDNTECEKEVITDQHEIEIRDAGHSIEISSSSGSMTSPVMKRSSFVSPGSTTETNVQNAPLKTVYLIRHAESDENRRLMSLTRSLTTFASLSVPAKEDILASVELLDVKAQLDSDVSDVGKRQIAQLAFQLQRAKFVEKSKIQLVAHSPLRRARQTSEGMLGCVSPRAPVISTSSNDSVSSSNSSKQRKYSNASSFSNELAINDGRDEMPLFAGNPCGSTAHQLNPKVAIQQIKNLQAQRQKHGPHRTLAEDEYTSVGKQAPTVSRVVELPALMERTPMEWLHPILLANRIAEFENWLAEQPETIVAIVGHSQYFKTMLGLDFKFQNCDVWELQFSPSERRRGVQSVLEDGAGTNTTALHDTLAKSEAAALLKEMQDRKFFTNLTIAPSPREDASSKMKCESTDDEDIEEKIKSLPKGWSNLKLLYRFDPSDNHVATF